jgi:hypothetical protein
LPQPFGSTALTPALANEGNDIELLKPDPPQLPPHPDAGFVPYVLVEHVHYLPPRPGRQRRRRRSVLAVAKHSEGFGNEPLNWFTARPTASLNSTTDTDGDGLPDYWEIERGLNPNSSVGANGANGDPDGDGQSNRQEFLAGTSPNDAADYLRISSAVVSAGGVTIGFRAVGGHTYSVLYSDTSPAGPWHKLTDAPVSANSAPVAVVDQTIRTGGRFYRLVRRRIQPMIQRKQSGAGIGD